MEGNKPEHKIRYGSITGTVWKREAEGKNGKFEVYNVVIENNYKDKDDQWQKNANFSLNDLSKVSLIAMECEKWIHEKRGQKE